MNETPPSKTRRWAQGLGLASFALFIALGFSLLDVWRAERASAWPTASGLIVESRLGPYCGSRGRDGFRPHVHYTYQVGGVLYRNQRILYGAAGCYSRAAAKATTDQFPAASSVKVSYDPQDPAESVLIAGKVDDSTWGAISFFALWFVLAAGATGMAVIVARTEGKPGRGLPPQRELGKGS